MALFFHIEFFFLFFFLFTVVYAYLPVILAENFFLILGLFVLKLSEPCFQDRFLTA